MRIADTYFVRLPNGTTAWLAVGKPVPDGAEIIEVRPVIMPDDGKVLVHKETGDISSGHWLKDDSADNWVEIPEPKEEGAE